MKNILLIGLISTICAVGLNAQTKKSSNNLQTAINQVRELFFKRDFNGGSEIGKKLLETYPDNLELNAWYLMNLSRSDDDSEAIGYAENLVKKHGENLWNLISLTIAQAYSKPDAALATGDKLMKIAPDDEQAIFVYYFALYQNSKEQEAYDLLEKNEAKIKDKSRLLTYKALSSYYIEARKEKGQIQKSFDLFTQAIKVNPNSVNANFLYGYYLREAKMYNEALPFFRKAATLSPNSSVLQNSYWGSLEQQTNKTDVQKKAEFDTAITNYVRASKNSPQALSAAWKRYRDLAGWKDESKPEEVKKRDYYENLILQKYPNTKYDEEIAYTQTLTVYGKYFGKKDKDKVGEIGLKKKSNRTAEENALYEKYGELEKLYIKEQITLQRDFLKRPKHFNLTNLGQTAFSLFRQLCSQKDSTDAEIASLLKIVSENLLKNYWGNLNTDIASYLIERREHRSDSQIAQEAEKYARLGFAEAENKVNQLPPNSSKIKAYEALAIPLNVLADSLTGLKKFGEAEKLLKQAAEMQDNSGNENFELENAASFNRRAWARFYIAQNDWEKAGYYHLENGGDNEWTRKIFEDFYEKRNGKKDGFDAYYAGIEAKLKIKVKEKILKSRIKNPQPMVAFDLKTIEDKTVASANLKGKIIVINIWGTWCGPCVAEMPELQKVHEKYKNDKDVAILTLDSNDELADVKKFISEKKYTLPVLIDANYTDKIPQFSSKRVYPTTLFIDKNGKVSFIVRGASPDLLETFSWRIDILKEDK